METKHIKKLSLCMATVLLAGNLFAGCGSAPKTASETSSQKIKTAEATESESKVDSGSENQKQESEDDTAEGCRTDYDGFYSEVAWTSNENMKIFGKFYYPKDFDKSQKYPTVVLAHGGSVTYEIWEKTKWVDYFASKGYVTYAFDFCGGSKNSKSDGSLEEYMTPLTEKRDLMAVTDFVYGQPFVDTNHFYMMGQSYGGFETAITAGEYNDTVDGIILMYPAFLVTEIENNPSGKKDKEDTGEVGGDRGNDHPDQYYSDMASIDLKAEMTKYTGPVLIIHGKGDKTVPISYSENAVANIYPRGQARLVKISGKQSIHAFEIMFEKGRQKAREAADDFLSSLK